MKHNHSAALGLAVLAGLLAASPSPATPAQPPSRALTSAARKEP